MVTTLTFGNSHKFSIKRDRRIFSILTVSLSNLIFQLDLSMQDCYCHILSLYKNERSTNFQQNVWHTVTPLCLPSKFYWCFTSGNSTYTQLFFNCLFTSFYLFFFSCLELRAEPYSLHCCFYFFLFKIVRFSVFFNVILQSSFNCVVGCVHNKNCVQNFFLELNHLHHQLHFVFSGK